MKLSLFGLTFDEICSYSTNLKQTRRNKRKLIEIRRNSTNYILYKSVLIGVQGEIFIKILFLNVILALYNAANMRMRSEIASNLPSMCRFNPLHG